MTKKTLAMRFLEGQGVQYDAREYPPHIKEATEVASVLNVSENTVFKTLVAVRKGGRPLLAILPSNRKLDLKALSRLAGEKKIRMATHKQAEAITNLKVGGISPVALVDKGFDMYIHNTATSQQEIYISSGVRGRQIRLRPRDLINVTKATVADIAA